MIFATAFCGNASVDAGTLANVMKRPIQGGRETSVIILTDDYLCYKEPKSPYNFFNELFKFKTSDEWQY